MLKHLYIMITMLVCLTTLGSTSHAGQESVQNIYKQVESLKISWKGYTLGAELDSVQKEIARKNLVSESTAESVDSNNSNKSNSSDKSGKSDKTASNTYKFKDNGLNIVVDSKTDRVVIIFETFENASQQKARDLIGSLIISFKDPTISAHDKIVYWAYGEEGKYSADKFEAAKEAVKNRQEPLTIIATVKLQSEIPIMAKDADKASGTVYYIISSEALLKQIQSKQE